MATKIKHKLCPGCQNTKSTDSFNKNRQRQDGLCYWCRECRKNYDASRKEALHQHNKEYRNNNKEKISAASKIYYNANKEKLLKYRQDHIEDRNIYNKLYYQNNTKKIAQNVASWKRDNPSKVLEYKQKRRAQKFGVNATLKTDQWYEMLEYFNHACVYCQEHNEKLTQDHVLALSNGGEHDMYNIPACRSCNSKKGNKISYEYLEKIINIINIKENGNKQ